MWHGTTLREPGIARVTGLGLIPGDGSLPDPLPSLCRLLISPRSETKRTDRCRVVEATYSPPPLPGCYETLPPLRRSRAVRPPLRPASRASSGVHWCATPLACAALPPLLAISR